MMKLIKRPTSKQNSNRISNNESPINNKNSTINLNSNTKNDPQLEKLL